MIRVHDDTADVGKYAKVKISVETSIRNVIYAAISAGAHGLHTAAARSAGDIYPTNIITTELTAP